jgi:hypothetical protein
MARNAVQIDDDPESETEALGTLPKPGVYCGAE